jgi:hypothetical protein
VQVGHSSMRHMLVGLHAIQDFALPCAAVPQDTHRHQMCCLPPLAMTGIGA